MSYTLKLGTKTINGVVNQAATFPIKLTWKDTDGNVRDLTGYTAELHVRTSDDAASTLYEGTSSGGGITLTDTKPNIDATIPYADTTLFDADDFPAVYDLRLISAGGEATRLIQGTLELDTAVTK